MLKQARQTANTYNVQTKSSKKTHCQGKIVMAQNGSQNSSRNITILALKLTIFKNLVINFVMYKQNMLLMVN